MSDHPTGYTKEQIKARKKFMEEFESTYADGSYTGMGNRDKEFMDNIKFDLHNVPDKLDDPEVSLPHYKPKVEQPSLADDLQRTSHSNTGEAPRQHSAAYKKFIQTWGKVPETSSYGGQAAVPRDAHVDFKDIPEYKVEEYTQQLEEHKHAMTPEEYNYLHYKRDLRPEALPQDAEAKRKEREFVASFEGFQDQS